MMMDVVIGATELVQASTHPLSILFCGSAEFNEKTLIDCVEGNKANMLDK